MKKLFSLLLLLCLLVICFASCGNPELNGVKKSDAPTNYVLMNVKDYGDILIELYPDVAPITVANFKKLVSEKFYDGLTFHRVIEDFMIQGGNSSTKNPTTIKGEFSENGFDNPLKHERGVISMARSNDPNSASGQFFIMHKASSSLDGRYAAFGKVLYGLDTVDKIATTETTYNFYSGEKSVPQKKIVINYVQFVTIDGSNFAK